MATKRSKPARSRKSAPRRPRRPHIVAKPRRRSPRSQVLPGMEQVRDQRLDNLCEAISDEREQMNAAKVEEGKLVASALQRMHDKAVLLYTHNGIELIRAPGAEKLRVRVVKVREVESDAGGEAFDTETTAAAVDSDGADPA